MIDFTLIFLSVFLNALAQIFLKIASSKLNASVTILEKVKSIIIDLNFLLGFLCYGVSIVVWVYVLSRVKVSIAYPMQSMGYIIGTLLAYLILSETVTHANIVGLILITSGVLIISRSI